MKAFKWEEFWEIDYGHWNSPEKIMFYNDDCDYFFFRFPDSPSHTLFMRRIFGINQIKMENTIKKYNGRWEAGADYSLDAVFDNYLDAINYLNDILVPLIMSKKLAGDWII